MPFIIFRFPLRAIAQREAKAGKIKLDNPKPLFDHLFIDSVKKNGKWYEAGVSGTFMLMTKGIGGAIGYAPMGFELWKKGKLSILPHTIKGKDELKRIFEEVEK